MRRALVTDSMAGTDTTIGHASTGQGSVPTLARSVPLLVIAAVLCAGITAIHVIDQGGLTGLKEPPYVGYLYYALEIVGVIAAVLLLIPRTALTGWVLAFGVAAGPTIGYIVTRSVGLPDYTYGIGKWISSLGLISLAVEGLLLICSLVALAGVARGRSAAKRL